jgi:acetyltransferase EpsM
LSKFKNMTNEVYIMGAGGHAAVIIQALRAMGLMPKACYDDHSTASDVLGVPVVGTVSGLGTEFAELAVLGIGSNKVRQQLAQRFPRAQWVTVIHPASIVDSTVVIGAGSVILAGAIVQARTVLGQHVIINTGSVVDHDGQIESYAHIAQGSVLGGGVCVGEGATIGVGAALESGARVKAWESVTPGTAVLRAR